MKYIYTIFILSLAISCNIDEVYVDVYDPVQDRIDSMEQRKTDKNIIYSYLDNNNITSYDTTSSGVFYTVIDEGDSILYPEINDILSINIAGYYTNDSIFFTNDTIDLIIFESLGFIKTKILPFAIVALFGIAFFAVSARIWLPGDMMSPAPMN